MQQQAIMNLILGILCLGIVSISCSQSLSKEDRIYNEVDIFLDYIKERKEQKVYEMSYHVDYRNNITDPESRKNMVDKVSNLIHKFGLPAHEKWVLKQANLNYEVHIPISNYNDTNTVIKNVEIVVSYTPPGISNKIYQFNVDSELDPSKLKPLIPAPISNTSH